MESSELNSEECVRGRDGEGWVEELTVVVDPDAGAVLDCDAVVVDDLADGEVAEDDVGCVDD